MKNTEKHRAIVVAIPLAITMLTGCRGQTAGLDGLRPLYPPLQIEPTPKVRALQPTFRWAGVDDDSITYDLIVYRMNNLSWNTTDRLNGRDLPDIALNTARAFEQIGQHDDPEKPFVYYREGLSSTSHRIESPLAPATDYLWSIRTRKDDRMSPWSTADWSGTSRQDGFRRTANLTEFSLRSAGTMVMLIGARGNVDGDRVLWLMEPSDPVQPTRSLYSHPFVFQTTR